MMTAILGVMAALEAARRGQKGVEVSGAVDALKRDLRSALSTHAQCNDVLGALLSDDTFTASGPEELDSIRLPFLSPPEVERGASILGNVFGVNSIRLVPKGAVPGSSSQWWATLELRLGKSPGSAVQWYGAQEKVADANLILMDSNGNGRVDACVGSTTAAAAGTGESSVPPVVRNVFISPYRFRTHMNDDGTPQWVLGEIRAPSSHLLSDTHGWRARGAGARLTLQIDFDGQITNIRYLFKRSLGAPPPGQSFRVGLRGLGFAPPPSHPIHGTPDYWNASAHLPVAFFSGDSPAGTKMTTGNMSFGPNGLSSRSWNETGFGAWYLEVWSGRQGDQFFGAQVEITCSPDPNAVESSSVPPPCGRMP